MVRRTPIHKPGARSTMIGVPILVLALLGCSPTPSNPATTDVDSPPLITSSTSTLVGAEGSGEPEFGSESAPNRDDLMLDPSLTAEALADTSRVEQGVWSVLANLGISVLALDGTPVLVGSATGPDDYWMNDFQVPLLIEMVGRSPVSFDDYTDFMARLGFDGTAEDLASDYATVYEGARDEWLPSLFAAMGLDFAEHPDLTPFQFWLLLLDTIVVPNGSQGATAAEGAALSITKPVSAIRTDADEPCLLGSEEAAKSNWGWAYKAAKYAKGIADAVRKAATAAEAGAAAAGVVVLNPADIANAAILQALIETSLSVDSNQVHELHADGRWLGVPDEVEILASASFVADIPKDARCIIKAMSGVDFKAPGPKDLEGMQVRWTYSDVFTQHGTFELVDDPGDNSTAVNHLDAQGEQRIKYTSPAPQLSYAPKGHEKTGFAKDEPGSLPEISETGVIEAKFLLVMADIFNFYATASSLLFPRVEVRQVVVGWHEPWMAVVDEEQLTQVLSGAGITELRTCDGTHWDGTMTMDATAEVPGGHLQVTSSTPISFDLPVGQADKAEVPITMVVEITGTVDDASLSSRATVDQTLEVRFDHRAGTATITTRPLGGSVLAVVTSPDGSASASRGVDGKQRTVTVPIMPAEGCG